MVARKATLFNCLALAELLELVASKSPPSCAPIQHLEEHYTLLFCPLLPANFFGPICIVLAGIMAFLKFSALLLALRVASVFAAVEVRPSPNYKAPPSGQKAH